MAPAGSRRSHFKSDAPTSFVELLCFAIACQNTPYLPFLFEVETASRIIRLMHCNQRRVLGPLLSVGILCAISFQSFLTVRVNKDGGSLTYEGDFVFSLLPRLENNTVILSSSDFPSHFAVQSTTNRLDKRRTFGKATYENKEKNDVTATPHSLDLSSSTNQTHDDKKPTFVIHVGPSKTQTSTLQIDLRNMYEVLKKDNYAYLGVRRLKKHGVSQIHTSFVHNPCLSKMTEIYKSNNGTSVRVLPCWDRVHQEIQKWRKQNTSIIMSEEIVSNKESPLWRSDVFQTFTTALKETLGDEWNIVVVVGYRRYGEWILSTAKQYYGRGCADPSKKWNVGFCHNTWKIIKKWMNQRRDGSAKNFYWTPAVVRHWRQAFSNVKVLNTHAPGHVTEKFVCDILTDAPHTCQHTRTRSELPRAVNVRSSIDAALNNLAVAAREKGLFPEDTKRKSVLDEATKYDIKFQDLPLVCPSRDELEKLLNRSIALEQTILPDFHHSPLGEKTHRDEFWYVTDVKKGFCSLDQTADLIGDSKSWSELLEMYSSRNATGE
eukprot:scaffold11_cov142-Amphora_coffeaeformis.AAC.1